MTSGQNAEFRILGPLEVRIDGMPAALGGAKQRAVLAALLLNADSVISVERLIDDVWGDSSPPSAAHGLEAYISRLRQLLNGHGPTLLRRGAGYCLELRGATLDSAVFTNRLDEAADAADEGDAAGASNLAAAALALWHGPALADVALASAGRAEAERLEELRLRAYELRFDAELELGRKEAIVGELQVLVGQNPYRERFVAQLMLALYRSGRQAEALEVYEQTRRRLNGDLGLQPSPELQQLSGQIVRQEAHLRAPPTGVNRVSSRPRRSGRVATLVAGGLAAAAVMTLTASGSTPAVESGPLDFDLNAERVALVLPRDPAGADVRDPAVYYSALGFRNATTAWGQEAETIVVAELEDVERRARDVVDGDFDLVVVAGDGPVARALAPLVRDSRSTRFAFVGSRLADLGIANAPNAVGYPFADQESAQLAGYASGLVPPRGSRAARTPDMLSVVASPRTPYTERVVAGFTKGAKRASPKLRVRVDYLPGNADRTACERVANGQIDAGSDVVFALGSSCSSAALAVVRARGVWGVRVDDERAQRGDHIVGSLTKYWEAAVPRPINDLELSELPAGKDIELGLADDYSVMFEAYDESATATIWSKVVRLCSTIRSHTVDDT